MHHERLERRLAITRSLRSKADYVRFLARLYGFHLPLEARIAGFAPAFESHGVELRARLKAWMIERDLQALGLSAERIATLPRCRDLPDLANLPRALGCLYVLEGSTLGGQVIAHHVRAALEISQEEGIRYLSAYGAETGRMWQSFVAFLDTYEISSEELDDAIGAARDTFELLERWWSAR